MSMIIPPTLGIIINFVPERNALQGTETILIKILGIIIFRIKLPLEKSLPKKPSISSLKKNKNKQMNNENTSTVKKVF